MNLSLSLSPSLSTPVVFGLELSRVSGSIVNPAQPNELSDVSSRPVEMASQILSLLAWSTKCCGRAGEKKMAATSLSSSASKVTAAKVGGISRPSSSYTQLTFCSRHAFQKIGNGTRTELLLLSPRISKYARPRAATDNDRAAPAPAEAQEAAISADANPVASSKSSSNGTVPSEPAKRVPLTARERLRAARVLGRYAAAEPGAPEKQAPTGSSSKPEFGSRVLEALRETDAKKKGGAGGRKKRSSGLPEAPSNLLDDAKRGMPKEGWTFDWLAALPVGTDVLVVAASFGIITTVMFGTTYLVWKLGAIHFNEY